MERGQFLDEVHRAVRAAGPGALASGRAAARLWGWRVPIARIEAWAPGRAPALPGMTPSVRHDVPTVDAATALLVVAATVPAPEVVGGAEAVGVDVAALAARADQWCAARGPSTPRVRELLALLEQAPRPDSELERRFLQVLERAGLLARARLHERIALGRGAVEVDVAFAAEQVVVELDGWRHHRSREQFGRDRHRDVQLSALGWLVLRFTYADVERRPAWVIEQLRRTLAARRATGSHRSTAGYVPDQT